MSPTPNSQIRSVIRKLWLKSREANKMRALHKECEMCGSTEHLEIHHLGEIDWDRIFFVIREEILNDKLQMLCADCHKIKKVK